MIRLTLSILVKGLLKGHAAVKSTPQHVQRHKYWVLSLLSLSLSLSLSLLSPPTRVFAILSTRTQTRESKKGLPSSSSSSLSLPLSSSSVSPLLFTTIYCLRRQYLERRRDWRRNWRSQDRQMRGWMNCLYPWSRKTFFFFFFCLFRTVGKALLLSTTRINRWRSLSV